MWPFYPTITVTPRVVTDEVERGEVDVGQVNHYYLHRLLEE